jgi:20S proteasome alpha/beta subunit
LHPKLAQDREQAENAAKDAIHSISERDIYTGGNVEVILIDKEGIHTKREDVRKD